MKLPIALIGLMLVGATVQSVDARPSTSYTRMSSPSRSMPSYPRTAPVRVVTTPSGYGASNRTVSTPYPRSQATRAQDNALSGRSLGNYLTQKNSAPTAPPVRTAPPAFLPSSSSTASAPQVVTSVPSAPQVVHYHNDSSGDFLTGMAIGSLMHHDRAPQQTVIVQQPSAQPSVSSSGPAPVEGNVVPPQAMPSNSNGFVNRGQSHESDGSVLIDIICFLFVAGVIGVAVYLLVFKKKVAPSTGTASPTKHRSPVILGSGISLPVLSLMSDATTPGVVPLHFELAENGRQSIVGVGEYRGRKDYYDAYFTADGSLEDFIQVRGDETRIFSFIDSQNPASDAEWDMWLNDATGLIGMSTFSTPDGVDWSRCVLPGSASRIAPEVYKAVVTTASGERAYEYHEMLYRRATGFKVTGPATEYLLVRLERWMENDMESAVINVYAGAEVERTSLDLMS